MPPQWYTYRIHFHSGLRSLTYTRPFALWLKQRTVTTTSAWWISARWSMSRWKMSVGISCRWLKMLQPRCPQRTLCCIGGSLITADVVNYCIIHSATSAFSGAKCFVYRIDFQHSVTVHTHSLYIYRHSDHQCILYPFVFSSQLLHIRGLLQLTFARLT